jgi:hypothetical protein
MPARAVELTTPIAMHNADIETARDGFMAIPLPPFLYKGIEVSRNHAMQSNQWLDLAKPRLCKFRRQARQGHSECSKGGRPNSPVRQRCADSSLSFADLAVCAENQPKADLLTLLS